MTDIEKTLKEMPLMSPDAGLDERIGRLLSPSARPPVHPLRAPIPVWAALAACLVFGFLGFFLRATLDPGAPEIVRTVYVLESNPFSMGSASNHTSAAAAFLTNDVEVVIIGAEDMGV